MSVRDSFYASDAWRELRYRALKASNGRCQCCGARPTADNPLHVDHIQPRSKYPQFELELSNLQVLCAECNLGKRAWDQTDWRPVGKYLVRGGNGKRAHIWTGTDTRCRMYSTGGMQPRRYELVDELTLEQRVCRLCAGTGH